MEDNMKNLQNQIINGLVTAAYDLKEYPSTPREFKMEDNQITIKCRGAPTLVFGNGWDKKEIKGKSIEMHIKFEEDKSFAIPVELEFKDLEQLMDLAGVEKFNGILNFGLPLDVQISIPSELYDNHLVEYHVGTLRAHLDDRSFVDSPPDAGGPLYEAWVNPYDDDTDIIKNEYKDLVKEIETKEKDCGLDKKVKQRKIFFQRIPKLDELHRMGTLIDGHRGRIYVKFKDPSKEAIHALAEMPDISRDVLLKCATDITLAAGNYSIMRHSGSYHNRLYLIVQPPVMQNLGDYFKKVGFDTTPISETGKS